MFKKQKTISWILLLVIVFGLLPTHAFANNYSSEVITDSCNFEFQKTADWGSGFNGEIIITNTSKETIENWAISFDFKHQIANFWSADLVLHEGNSYGNCRKCVSLESMGKNEQKGKELLVFYINHIINIYNYKWEMDI